VADTPWYEDGLRFACTRCGHCCTGAPGTVLVSDDEIEVLAGRCGMTDEEFRAAYTRRLRGGAVSLRELRGGACVFYAAGRGCGVYEDRPRQCRTWPFWKGVLHSRERWQQEAQDCPGMDRGPLHSRSEIETVLMDDGTSG